MGRRAARLPAPPAHRAGRARRRKDDEAPGGASEIVERRAGHERQAARARRRFELHVLGRHRQDPIDDVVLGARPGDQNQHVSRHGGFEGREERRAMSRDHAVPTAVGYSRERRAFDEPRGPGQLLDPRPFDDRNEETEPRIGEPRDGFAEVGRLRRLGGAMEGVVVPRGIVGGQLSLGLRRERRREEEMDAGRRPEDSAGSHHALPLQSSFPTSSSGRRNGSPACSPSFSAAS
jgi:hypothetical protein